MPKLAEGWCGVCGVDGEENAELEEAEGDGEPETVRAPESEEKSETPVEDEPKGER